MAKLDGRVAVITAVSTVQLDFMRTPPWRPRRVHNRDNDCQSQNISTV